MPSVNNVTEEDNIRLCDAVDGEFAISGTLLSFHDVIDSLEGKTTFFFGYYRFIDHPYIRKIKNTFRKKFGFDSCLLFCSVPAALLELLRCISVEENRQPARLILVDVDDILSQFENHVPSIQESASFAGSNISSYKPHPKDLIIIQSRSVSILERHRKFITSNLIPVVAVYDHPADIIDPATIAEYHLLPLFADSNILNGCAILSNETSLMNRLSEDFRIRGTLLSSRNAKCFIHSRKAKVNRSSVEKKLNNKLAAMEEAENCFLFPSGMNALATITDILVSQEKNEVITIGHCYTDTRAMMQYTSQSEFGIKGIFLDTEELENLEQSITHKTAAILTESITNPLNDVPDLDYIFRISRQHDIPIIVDNTIATPFNLKPLAHGATIVMHSTTKFLNGKHNHGGGCLVSNDPALSNNIYEYQRILINTMSPLEMEVLLSNLNSFEERMVRFNQNAITIANWLENHKKVKKVYFNYLKSHRSYTIARKLLNGPGAVVSFTLIDDSEKGLKQFYDTPMNTIKKSPSLGSNHTLICPYTLLAHYQESNKSLAEVGLSRYLIRLSVGCEFNISPILEDIERAL